MFIVHVSPSAFRSGIPLPQNGQPVISGEPRQLKQLVLPKPTLPGAFRGLARTPQFISFEGARAVRTALS